VRLVRGKIDADKDDGTRWLSWEPKAPLPPGTLDRVDAVIHLAGENVASRRWSEEQKKNILESRTIPTRHLAEAAAKAGVRVFLCASAVGFYGDRGNEVLTEDSPRGTGFFPETCAAWEEATSAARDSGLRVANLRIGVVLSAKGGALAKQLLPFKLGMGAVLGSGKQWIPWIAIDDVVGTIHHCMLTEAVRGPVNVVGPNPVTNREFTKTLARVLGRPAFMWLPRFALRAMFGQIADEALLASMHAVPRKLMDTGFTFRHAHLADALGTVLGRE
jgi:uncharacterized protein (TIGR01777 family)